MSVCLCVECETCGHEFCSEIALGHHRDGKACRRFEDMTANELKQRRYGRRTRARRRGEKVRKVEKIEVKGCGGGIARCTAKFCYLGSMTTSDCASSEEIARRMILAETTFWRLKKIWDMKGLSLKLKARLYSALVLSVMLYNCEVWTITEREMEVLEAKHVGFLKKIFGRVEDGIAEVMHREEVKRKFEIRSIKELIRERRVGWIGHSARRGEEDWTWKEMVLELEDDQAGWGRMVWKDLNAMGLKTVKEVVEAASDRGGFTTKLHKAFPKAPKQKKKTGGEREGGRGEWGDVLQQSDSKKTPDTEKRRSTRKLKINHQIAQKAKNIAGVRISRF